MIWKEHGDGNWTKQSLQDGAFTDVVWRVSWSPAGNVLAVSAGDSKVSLWKENAEGSWVNIGDVEQ